MSDGNKLLTKAYSKYGADMGRRKITDNPTAKVRLFKMRMVDSCYDVGGAYWGMGTPLYAAIGDDFQWFTRQENRRAAKEELLKEFPNLKFYQ